MTTTDALRELGLAEALAAAIKTGQHVEQHRQALICFYRRLGLYA
jgi:hypothetical protein